MNNWEKKKKTVQNIIRRQKRKFDKLLKKLNEKKGKEAIENILEKAKQQEIGSAVNLITNITDWIRGRSMSVNEPCSYST